MKILTFVFLTLATVGFLASGAQAHKVSGEIKTDEKRFNELCGENKGSSPDRVCFEIDGDVHKLLKPFSGLVDGVSNNKGNRKYPSKINVSRMRILD